LESGHSLGGTWYWNRYPGSRCDVESRDYSYSFDPGLEVDWTWSERFASQPEILQYLNFVADRYSVQELIDFDATVSQATYDDTAARWVLTVGTSRTIRARFCVAASGPLSIPQVPSLDGLAAFSGTVLHTGRWPHERVSFEGQRVAIVGTGSSGIQLLPEVAAEADQVVVFQRTPNFSVPSHNRLITDNEAQELRAESPARRRASRESKLGYPLPAVTAKWHNRSVLDVSDAERETAFETAWAYGGPTFTRAFSDVVLNPRSNELTADFVRNKIQRTVVDRVTAAKLQPVTYPIGTKRICVDSGYFETFNHPHVSLVDVLDDPIKEVHPRGLRTRLSDHEVDTLILATGFDAMTGALRRMDIRGRGGLPLRDAWHEGPRTYLGLMTSGFPNLFIIGGPGSPSVFAQMFLTSEQQADWITGCISYLVNRGIDAIEADQGAQQRWSDHVNDVASQTLLLQANSWWIGANIPGKPRVFMPYAGGLTRYREECERVATEGYEGFALNAPMN
jgi:cyclohexanone monooxygenase